MSSLAQQISTLGDPALVLFSEGQKIERSASMSLGCGAALQGCSRIALVIRSPIALVRCLIAFDGQVDAILLLSYTMSRENVSTLVVEANCDAIVSDCITDPIEGLALVSLQLAIGNLRRTNLLSTNWLMTTSGTTGLPKIVPHTLRSLCRSVYRFGDQAAPVWGLLYEPTRFAGLQVVLQALIGGGTLIAADVQKPLSEQLAVLINGGCTHLSATPTLWRRILMAPGHGNLNLRQVTLGGEIADQATLNALIAKFPYSRVSHIYASTEAGVGFSVTDGQAGFPLTYLERAPGNVRLKIVDDILWLRPPITAISSNSAGIEIDDEGFIRSGDRVHIDIDRVKFMGRENGLINIGGIKVYPETIEAIIKSVNGVALVYVAGKRSALTGSLVTADIQLSDGADPEETKARILQTCRNFLPREAVPATIRFVSEFDLNAAGKLARLKG